VTVAMMVDNPEGSQETYDKVRERLGLRRPAGGILHVAGPSPKGGWRVIEVWESEEAAKRFVERLRPAFEAVGAPRPLRPSSGRCTTTWRRSHAGGNATMRRDLWQINATYGPATSAQGLRGRRRVDRVRQPASAAPANRSPANQVSIGLPMVREMIGHRWGERSRDDADGRERDRSASAGERPAGG
jgi:hypothetical protein